MLSLTMSTIIRGIPASKTRMGFKGLILPIRRGQQIPRQSRRRKCQLAGRRLQRIEGCKDGPVEGISEAGQADRTDGGERWAEWSRREPKSAVARWFATPGRARKIDPSVCRRIGVVQV